MLLLRRSLPEIHCSIQLCGQYPVFYQVQLLMVDMWLRIEWSCWLRSCMTYITAVTVDKPKSQFPDLCGQTSSSLKSTCWQTWHILPWHCWTESTVCKTIFSDKTSAYHVTQKRHSWDCFSINVYMLVENLSMKSLWLLDEFNVLHMMLSSLPVA